MIGFAEIDVERGFEVSTLDFERCNLFLAEDNRYIRNVLDNLLRHLSFKNITVAKDGAEAIDYFKIQGSAGHLSKSHAVDLVISDLVMSPVNGLLLLRWLRTAKESPNRFIPFIMLSGAADNEYVHAARDLGVTEFLAKPFSAETVSKKILEVINYPRQFVTTENYFGPDRRRQQMHAPPKERRIKDENDVTVVYSADKVVKPEHPTDVWYFRLPNYLKEKAGGMGMSSPGELPMNFLEEAEEQLQRDALDFTEWAHDYLKRLSRLCSRALKKEEGRRKYFEEINVLAHELRGQGGTFGYPLITTFGKMLYDTTGTRCREDDNAVEIVKAHIDAMRAVLRDKVSGDGGQIGRELLASLEAGVKRLTMTE